jgi:hypothetical protein
VPLSGRDSDGVVWKKPSRVKSDRPLLGHVDSYLGPGIFFELKTLKANDLINVTFPDRLVFGSHGARSLQLVTCGGPFDSATGHYLANVVVFSHLVSVSPPKG